MGNHYLLAFTGEDQKPGSLRWCKMDFATIHSTYRSCRFCEGKISWPLCWVRVVDELRRHGVSERRRGQGVEASDASAGGCRVSCPRRTYAPLGHAASGSHGFFFGWGVGCQRTGVKRVLADRHVSCPRACNNRELLGSQDTSTPCSVLGLSLRILFVSTLRGRWGEPSMPFAHPQSI